MSWIQQLTALTILALQAEYSWYQGCWYAGFLHHQSISNDDIDYEG